MSSLSNKMNALAISKPASGNITPAEHELLKVGPKIQVWVGPQQNRFIGIELASKALLAHYSPFVARLLSKEPGLTRINIPDGDKQTMVWIYKYMLSGEKNPIDQPRLEDLQYPQLVELLSHAKILEYTTLTNRVAAEIKSKLRAHILPSCDSRSIYGLLNAVEEIYEDSDKQAEVWTLFTNAILFHWLRPGVGAFDVDEWLMQILDCGDEDLYHDAIVQASYDRLDALIAAGKKYYKSPKMAKEIGDLNRNYYYRNRKSLPTHGARKQHPQHKSLVCFKCGRKGHIAKFCKQKSNEKIVVQGNGQGLTTYDKTAKKGQYTRLGLEI